MTTKLSGKKADNWIDKIDEWFYKFSKILAHLHVALSSCQEVITYWNNSLLYEMNTWVKKSLLESKQALLQIDEVNSAISDLAEIYHLLPKQLIHRDAHLSNFLFENDVFRGYHSIIRLKDIEREAIHCVMKIIEILCLAYFIENGDDKLFQGSVRNIKFLNDYRNDIQMRLTLKSI